MTVERVIEFEGQEIHYLLERKRVKNLNLRINRDGSVYVSANRLVSIERIDNFVARKGRFILKAQKRFREIASKESFPKQYVNGELFSLLGREISLKVEQRAREGVSYDGVYLRLCVKYPDDFAKKQRMLKRYLDEQCRILFGEILLEVYPLFQKYGVPMPELRIREMKTQWGSCLTKKGIITLNKRLLAFPRPVIEYVAVHEFCHFIHPNHSKGFYALLAVMMPDWKERKACLERRGV